MSSLNSCAAAPARYLDANAVMRNEQGTDSGQFVRSCSERHSSNPVPLRRYRSEPIYNRELAIKPRSSYDTRKETLSEKDLSRFTRPSSGFSDIKGNSHQTPRRLDSKDSWKSTNITRTASLARDGMRTPSSGSSQSSFSRSFSAFSNSTGNFHLVTRTDSNDSSKFSTITRAASWASADIRAPARSGDANIEISREMLLLQDTSPGFQSWRPDLSTTEPRVIRPGETVRMFIKRQRKQATKATIIQQKQQDKHHSNGVVQQLAQAISTVLLVTSWLVFAIGIVVVYIKCSTNI